MKSLRSLTRLALLVSCCCGWSSCYDNGYYSYAINWKVDPVFGNDVFGDGSAYFPFKTVGKALRNSIPGDGVILAPGTYTASSGEVFPLLVKPGVAILGDPATFGSTRTVIGGGNYTIQGGTQMGNVVTAAFVMGSGTQLSGVKVTVAGGSGVGVVFDGNSGSLDSCTLTGCGASGVQVFQSASPTLTNNVITTSGASGVTLFDTAGPILRQNQILNSGTDGVLANDTSAPNLGDAATAGGNTLQGNAGVGLNNATTASTIQAVGNTWELLSGQGSDAAGHYAAALVPGIVAAVAGNDFALTFAAANIQF